MPLYEYTCTQDGSTLEVLRPMADADKPLPDPEGRGRTFTRKLSTFATSNSTPGPSHSLPRAPGCCPCGKTSGSCGNMA